jgi:hypothetical protein
MLESGVSLLILPVVQWRYGELFLEALAEIAGRTEPEQV